jgi:5'-deoxynucleotidase YfbR-like HD superfamily hydrolase
VLNVRELLIGRARHLSYVTRFAGTPVLRPENVAEHSYMTAQYAFMIARHCEELGSRKVNMEKLLIRALVHDMDEAVMVDLPRPIKYADEELRKRWNALCHRVIQELQTALGIPFFAAWLEAKDETLEGEILRLADFMSVTAYVIEEIRRGNSFMQEVLKGNIEYLSEHLRRGDLPTTLTQLTFDTRSIAQEYLK